MLDWLSYSGYFRFFVQPQIHTMGRSASSIESDVFSPASRLFNVNTSNVLLLGRVEIVGDYESSRAVLQIYQVLGGRDMPCRSDGETNNPELLKRG